MVDEKINWPTEEVIGDAIRSMPEAEVPEGFSARVMSGLAPKRPTLWRRFRMWLVEPKMLSFTPLSAASAVAALLVMFTVGQMSLDDKNQGQTASGVTVRFVLNDASVKARTVAVVGSFNHWKAEEAVMHYDETHGAWVLEATLPPGDHEYMFLVDGNRLMTDPHAQVTRDDGFGNRNALLFVSGSNAMAL